MTRIITAARGGITSRFGQNIGRGFPHRGIDQGHGTNTGVDLEIRAPADGIVLATGWFGTYGNRIVIRHPDGWTSLLAHHSAQFVHEGQEVKQGEVIARMGNTGTIFVHSHQELMNEKGEQVDPLANLGTTTAAVQNKSSIDIEQNGDEELATTYYREDGKGTLGLFTDTKVRIFGSQRDYDIHRETVITTVTKDPTGQAQKQYAAGLITIPPDSNNKDNFINLDPPHWAMAVAVRRG